ncbi:MAG: hypothetical protein ACRD5W_02250, partial [Candidatus Acidiferrales bacterium]
MSRKVQSSFAKVAALLCMATAASAQVPEPGTGTNIRREPKPVVAPVFRFQSGFWLNLHHFLYQQARLHSERPVTRTGAAASGKNSLAAAQAPVDTSALTPEQSKAWSAALDYYAA